MLFIRRFLVGAKQIVGSFADPVAIAALAAESTVLTIEIEHIDTSALENAAAKGILVEPSPQTIKLIQDKYLQKQTMEKAGIPLGKFASVTSINDIQEKIKDYGLPLMLKSRKLAYDGRGNYVIRTTEDIQMAWNTLSTKGELYVEQWVPFKRELAVIVVRNTQGECLSYNAVETIQKDNICHIVIAPAQISGDILARARHVAGKAIATLTGAGVYGVELFELDDGSIYLNEIAPRVHNSGHFTIEACNTSQFEQHVRAVTGLPLGNCDMRVGASVMINVLGMGDSLNDTRLTWDICERANKVSGATVHWYGKKGTAKGRKVGHITLTGPWMPEVLSTVSSILQYPSSSSSSSSNTNTSIVSTIPPWITNHAPLVGIIMGSDSDLPTMQPAAGILKDMGIPFELTIVSAHRTPKRMVTYANTARERGLKVIIAGAGGAAHLPGMVAAMTSLPVIGVPVPLKHLDGVDSLHSILQMPRGVPVATVAIGNSTNAGLLAARILGSFIPSIGDNMENYQERMEKEVLEKAERMRMDGWETFLNKK